MINLFPGEEYNITIRGFLSVGKHINGTEYDDRGFDWWGLYQGHYQYDNRGFDVLMWHKNGTEYDDYDFDIDYIDKSGASLYDERFNWDSLSKKLFNKKDIEEYISQMILYLQNYQFQKYDEKLAEFTVIYPINIEKFKNLKKEAIKKFFGDYNNELLNDEKYDILTKINESSYHLIKARAGTGKTTLVSYMIKLLTQGYDVDPNEILAFAFNKSAALEVNKRTQSIGVKDFCSAMTFHSFAGRILSRTSPGSYDLLFDGSGENKKKDQTLTRYVTDIVKKINRLDHKKKLYELFRSETYELETMLELSTDKKQYDFYRNDEGQNICLDGTIVKSKAENWIADFLFEHGIGFRYEHPLTNKLITDKNNIRRQLRPDFTLTDIPIHSIYKNKDLRNWKTIIEFWGMPGNAEYFQQMQWKKNLYKNSFKRLLIDFSIEDIDYRSSKRREEFEQKIKTKLENMGIVCQKLPFDILFEKCSRRMVSELIIKTVSFINKAKQNKLTPDALKNVYHQNRIKYANKLKIFYQFALDIYTVYQSSLEQDKKKDFNDILFECGEDLLSLGSRNQDIKFKIGQNLDLDRDKEQFQYIKNLKYLFIDEYQDFSLLYYSLLEGIKKINPNIKIIAVGDDRQLINSFAGSKITYIKDFVKYFPDGKTHTLLETNRCPILVTRLSNQFMKGLGEGTTNRMNASGGVIKGYIISDMKGLNDQMINNRLEIIVPKDSDDIIFFTKAYKDLEIVEYRDKDDTYKESIIVPKDNISYAQQIKTLFNILIEEDLYGINFDENNKSLNDKNKKIMILYRNNILEQGCLHRLPGETNITMSDVQDHLTALYSRYIVDKYNVTKKDIALKIFDNVKNIIISQTIHTSKGGEADIVVILGVNSGIYPSLHPDNELNAIFGETKDDVIAEEKRLFYVAMTRTKNKLYYVSESSIVGNDHGDFLINSRFSTPN